MKNLKEYGLIEENVFEWDVKEEKDLSLKADAWYYVGGAWSLTFAW